MLRLLLLLNFFVVVFPHLVATAALPQVPPNAPTPLTIPYPRNIIYVQSLWTESPNVTSNGTHISLLPLIEHNTRVTHVIIAALALSKTDTSDVTLNGLSPTSPYYSWLWSETAQLQTAGVKVMLMLGGAGSVAFNLLQQDFLGYYPPLLETLQATAVDGIDLDIEESFPSSVSLNAVLQLLRQLAEDMGDAFTITMAPVATDFTEGRGLEGVAWNYTVLDAAATSDTRPSGKIVDWYNVQFYDGYGDPGTTDDYDSIIANGWDASRVGFGLATYNLSGWYPLDVYTNVVEKLRDRYPAFGGVDGWEYGVAGKDETAPTEPWQWVESIGEAVFGSNTLIQTIQT